MSDSACCTCGCHQGTEMELVRGLERKITELFLALDCAMDAGIAHYHLCPRYNRMYKTGPEDCNCGTQHISDTYDKFLKERSK